MRKIEQKLNEIDFLNTTAKGKKKKQRILKGIPAVLGIGFGNAVVVQKHNYIISYDKITPEQVPSEVERFEKAVDQLYNQYKLSLESIETYSHREIGIYEAYLLIIKDPYINSAIIRRIENQSNVELAVAQEYDYQRNLIKNSLDPILKERANELNLIKEDLLATLRNTCRIIPIVNNSILVAHSLNPTDIAQLKYEGLQGIVTEVGGITSHASIIARSYNIPAIIGVKEITKLVEDNDYVLIDGFEGIVTINPTKDSIAKFHIKKNKEEARKQRLGSLIKMPTATMDGKKIKLFANISEPSDVDRAMQLGAEGIGLVRTEFIFLKENSKEDFIKDVRELAKLYTEYTEKAYPNIVTFRVFDIGSDKYPLIINRQEKNPALGLRGIRYLLTNKQLFKTQIKAILKASANKNAQILLPMISTIDELKKSLEIIEECKKSLIKEKRAFNPFIPIGVMIETPASALIADELAKYCDFFSIGTNDLTQYTLAVDRTSELVADYFNDTNPAILKLIKLTIDAGKKKGIPISVCGDMAGNPSDTSLLIGLGVDTLSVDTNLILEIKRVIRNSHYSECVKYANEMLSKIS